MRHGSLRDGCEARRFRDPAGRDPEELRGTPRVGLVGHSRHVTVEGVTCSGLFCYPTWVARRATAVDHAVREMVAASTSRNSVSGVSVVWLTFHRPEDRICGARA